MNYNIKTKEKTINDIFAGIKSDVWIVQGKEYDGVFMPSTIKVKKNKKRKCKAILKIADDYGDNIATIRCSRNRWHLGKHKKIIKRNLENKELDVNEIIIRWDKDEQECAKCNGIGWDFPDYYYKEKEKINNTHKAVFSEELLELERDIIENEKTVQCECCAGTGLKYKNSL